METIFIKSVSQGPIKKLTLRILRENPPDDLVNSRPFWCRCVATHAAFGLLGGSHGGSAPGGEEGGASEDGKGHG